jgi:hypothetical protein
VVEPILTGHICASLILPVFFSFPVRRSKKSYTRCGHVTVGRENVDICSYGNYYFQFRLLTKQDETEGLCWIAEGLKEIIKYQPMRTASPLDGFTNLSFE